MSWYFKRLNFKFQTIYKESFDEALKIYAKKVENFDSDFNKSNSLDCH